MVRLQTSIVSSLSSLSDEQLEEITADGHVFAGARWYRMLETLDLATLVGGRVELRFALVTAGGTPVAACPLMRACGEGIYFVYSLRRYFFEHWIEEAVRLEPAKRAHFARLFSAVSVYRRLLESTGASLDDCLIVSNPLSYRGVVPVAPSAPVARAEVYATLISDLQKHARRRRLPLWFLCVPAAATRLCDALAASRCRRVFQFFDNRLDVEGFDSFDDYLGSFRRTTRRAFLKDMRRTSDAGIELDFLDDFSAHATEFSRLYSMTYGRYGESYFRHPPEFWRTLHRSLGNEVEAIVATLHGRLVGFSILLKSARRGELWTYRIGRVESDEVGAAPFYFGLSFYGPIRRAIELGYRRVWLGPASYEAKSVRGARQSPLFSYFYFPRRWDRWFLAPYLELFGKVTEEQIAGSIERPLRLDADAPAPAGPRPRGT